MKIKDKVSELLETVPATRNSDIELYIMFFQVHICKTREERRMIRELFERGGLNVAGLTRCRADIQNKQGLFQSDEQILKFRKIKEVEKQNEYSNQTERF